MSRSRVSWWPPEPGQWYRLSTTILSSKLENVLTVTGPDDRKNPDSFKRAVSGYERLLTNGLDAKWAPSSLRYDDGTTDNGDWVYTLISEEEAALIVLAALGEQCE